MPRQFICIIACLVEQTNSICSSAVLFDTFQDALDYARKDAKSYKHLANNYIEKVGTGKRHASIQMNGKYINKSYTIRDLDYDKSANILCDHLSTYASWDYDHEGICV